MRYIDGTLYWDGGKAPFTIFSQRQNPKANNKRSAGWDIQGAYHNVNTNSRFVSGNRCRQRFTVTDSKGNSIVLEVDATN